MNPKVGEIWLADLGIAGKTRPVLVVSREDPDPPRVLFIYVPLTTQFRGSPYEVLLEAKPFLRQRSAANVQGIGSLPRPRFEAKLGSLSEEELQKVRGAIRFAIAL